MVRNSRFLRRLRAIVLCLPAFLVFAAPGTPLVANVSADGGCYQTEFGGKYGSGALWAQAYDSCTGDITHLYIAVFYGHCDYDVGGVCFHWSDFLGPIAGCTKDKYSSPWAMWVPTSGSCKQYGLIAGGLYHVQNHTVLTTVCCGLQVRDLFTQEFRV